MRFRFYSGNLLYYKNLCVLSVLYFSAYMLDISNQVEISTPVFFGLNSSNTLASGDVNSWGYLLIEINYNSEGSFRINELSSQLENFPFLLANNPLLFASSIDMAQLPWIRRAKMIKVFHYPTDIILIQQLYWLNFKIKQSR